VPTPDHNQPRAAPKRILIVEDNELNMKLLNDVLEFHGYQTIVAGEGEAALRLAREHCPDLILMDLQLPDICGLEVVSRLKRDPHTRPIPVVAVTAYAMAGDEARALAAGCDGYLAKPIMLREFLQVVDDFIRLGSRLQNGLE
jgi:two-component system, cell cycle response regulator DivK